MVAVAVLTALAVDLAYTSRVSLQIAANARDELRASWLARSGVGMSRLVLSFQQQLDDALPRGGGAALPRIQLWALVPVGSGLVDGLFAGPGAAGDGARQPSFDAKIEDEGRKANAQLEGLVQTGDRKLWLQVQSLYQVFCDARWDPLFDREDASGVRSTREDLLIRLRDWVDEDDRSSELVIAGGGGATCGMIPGQPPFADAFGDENQPYDRGENRYRAKNARMDSLDELYLVAGVGDAFMASFGDALTVYLPRDAKRNVNELDKRRLVQLAKIVADPPAQPTLLDAEFAERLHKLVVERTLGGLMSMSPRDFGTFVEAAGVRVNANLLVETNPNSPFTDRSSTFRIRASGSAGAVRSSIDAVVRLEQAQAGTPVATPGRLIHWRED
jgi:general secretion pathway protein K